MDLYSLVKTASLKVDAIEAKPRTRYSVYASAQSEMGELADEIRILEGDLNKEVGPDGVIGEAVVGKAVDVIACMLDLIHVHDPDVAAGVVHSLMQNKLQKWVRKQGEAATLARI